MRFQRIVQRAAALLQARQIQIRVKARKPLKISQHEARPRARDARHMRRDARVRRQHFGADGAARARSDRQRKMRMPAAARARRAIGECVEQPVVVPAHLRREPAGQRKIAGEWPPAAARAACRFCMLNRLRHAGRAPALHGRIRRRCWRRPHCRAAGYRRCTRRARTPRACGPNAPRWF